MKEKKKAEKKKKKNERSKEREHTRTRIKRLRKLKVKIAKLKLFLVAILCPVPALKNYFFFFVSSYIVIVVLCRPNGTSSLRVLPLVVKMICPKRTSELLDLHLAPFKDKDPAWEVGVSKIAGRGVMATRNLKRGEIIFTDSPLLIGLAAHEEDSLNSCSVCFKVLPDTRFMCRQGCGLPVCSLCAKKKQHKTDCDMFKAWGPNEPDVANSVIIRLLCVARAINLTKDQRDLIYCLQANLDNNHRTEVRNAAKCFKNFPTDKKLIEIMNRTVAVLRTNGFDKTNDRTTDNQEFNYRALYPLFGVMNHDCIPNSYYTFDEKTNNMIVRAALDIVEGEEITTTYTKLFTGNIARHLFLKMKKGFTCKCPRCSDSTVSTRSIKLVEAALLSL